MSDNSSDIYKLTYSIDGQACYAEYVKKGTRLSNHPRPEKENCVFCGWGDVPARMPAHDLTLDGRFETILYRAVFASGVVQYGIVEQAAGTPLSAPADPEKQGYQFQGWQNFSGVMPEENTTYEAVFIPCVYRAVYVVDGTVRFPFLVAYGDRIPLLDEPRKKNYIFSGWGDIPETMPDHDIQIEGSFSEKLFKLTRMVDGTIFSEELLPCGAPVDKKMKPVRQGYYFSGWRKLPETMPAKDVTVMASMYPARYRVDFYLNEELYETVYVPYGETISLPTPSIPEGGLFGGWNDVPETMPAQDLKLYGVVNAKLYTLTMMVDGTEYKRFELPAGASVPTDTEITPKEGYAFCGWDRMPEEMPAHDLTLYAVYATVRPKYLFVIDGEPYASLAPDEGEKLEMPIPPERDGYTFSGWDSTITDPRTGVTTISGTYQDDGLFKLEFFVRDELYEHRRLAAGEEIVLPQAPTAEEYGFIGWRNCPSVMPEHDLRIDAEVRALRHRLTFVIDGTVTYTMSLSHGQEIACPAVAQRPGFTFGGWQEVPRTMPDEDLTVLGSYIRNQHTVTYVVDGEIYYAGSVGSGERLTPPEIPPLKEDQYPFITWLPEIDTMPDEDTVITGVYADTHCCMEVYVDGLLYERKCVPNGMETPLPEIPERLGERFEWQNIPDKVPPGHMEIHGGYVPNTYTITYLMGQTQIGKEEYKFGEPIRSKLTAPENGEGIFLGWKGIEETMPAHDLTVQAIFESRVFQATFLLDDEVICEKDIAVGARIDPPEVPTREGYVFDGWHNCVEYMPPYSFTAVGSYKLKTYILTFLCGGDVLEEQEYTYGSHIDAPHPPDKDGAPFADWEGLPTTMPAADLTVSARYSGKVQRLTYLVDGEMVYNEHVEMGSKIVPYAPPAREGYTFEGWERLPEFMPDHEVVVSGTYARCDYAVTYKVDGIIWRIDRYVPGETIVPPAAPEHPHETFVRWQNIATIMPDYDFICIAEYSETYGYYAFVLDGETVAEGKCRKGETIIPPEAPHRSGFAFSGWTGFTGEMPAGNVTFVGSYTVDKFKISYLLDGEPYAEEGYNERENVIPVEPPVRDGYLFGGWHGIPKVMPADDVVVTGELHPLEYRLVYRTEEATYYDALVKCGSRLATVLTPEIHGFVFNGWRDEPEVMPPYPLTINGTYAVTEPQYKIITLDANVSEDTVQKGHPRASTPLAFVSGSTLRLLIDDICYPVIDSQDCICNCDVVDEDKLRRALRQAYRKNDLSKKKITIIYNDSNHSDILFNSPSCESIQIAQMAEEAFRRGEEGDELKHEITHRVLATHSDGGAAVFAMATVEKRNHAFAEAFKSCGVTVLADETLIGALVTYLQHNKRMERGSNQMCLFCLPNALIGVLLLDGQVRCVAQNRFPYRNRSFDLPAESEYIVRTLLAYADQYVKQGTLDLVAVGGIDRTHVRTCEKLLPHLFRRLSKERVSNLLPQRHYRRPAMVTLGFALTENRTK